MIKSGIGANLPVLLFILFFFLKKEMVYQSGFINALVYNKIFNYLLVI